MILHTKSLGSPKSFQEAPRKLQKIQGRNPEIISLAFRKKLSFHKDIMKSTDLYQYHSILDLYFIQKTKILSFFDIGEKKVNRAKKFLGFFLTKIELKLSHF